jgi:hypothetical protein
MILNPVENYADGGILGGVGVDVSLFNVEEMFDCRIDQGGYDDKYYRLHQPASVDFDKRMNTCSRFPEQVPHRAQDALLEV